MLRHHQHPLIRGLTHLICWIAAESLLNLVGLDTLADYYEFLVGQEERLFQSHIEVMAVANNSDHASENLAVEQQWLRQCQNFIEVKPIA